MIPAKPLAWNPSIMRTSSGNMSAVICRFVFIEKSRLLSYQTLFMMIYCIAGIFLSIVPSSMAVSKAAMIHCDPVL